MMISYYPLLSAKDQKMLSNVHTLSHWNITTYGVVLLLVPSFADLENRFRQGTEQAQEHW